MSGFGSNNSGDHDLFLIHLLLFSTIGLNLTPDPKLHNWYKAYYIVWHIYCVSVAVNVYHAWKKTKSEIDYCNQEFVRDIRV